MGKYLYMLNADGAAEPAGTGSSLNGTSVILTASGWADLVQTVSVDGVTADRNTCHIIVSPDPWSYDAYTEANVRCTGQGDGTLTFMAADAPEADITVNVLISK